MENAKYWNKDKFLKYLFLALFCLVNAFTIVESCLPGSLSAIQSTSCASFISIIGGGGAPQTIVEPTAVTLVGDSSIVIGTTKRYSVTFAPENVTDKSISYVSSDPNVIHIVQNGSIAYAEALSFGSATITATSAIETVKSEKLVTVISKPAPGVFTAQISKEEIVVGETSRVSILVDGFDNQTKSKMYYDNTLLHYSSSNDSVATIDKYGVITAKSVGNTAITIQENPSIHFDISVVAGVITSPTELDIVGELTVHTYDIDYEDMFSQLSIDWGAVTPSDQSVVWTCDSDYAALISDDGKLYGYKASGVANVTAFSCMDPTIKRTVEVHVDDVIAMNMAISPLPSFAQGSIASVTPTFLPLNTTDTSIVATSSDSSIIKVASSGRVVQLLGVASGKATITVKSNSNPSLTQDLVVEVVIMPANQDSISSFLRKFFGHFGLFVLNGLLGYITFFYFMKDSKKYSNKMYIMAVSFLLGILVAGLTEIIQLFVPNRTGSFTDVLIDVGGYVVGTLIAIFAYWLAKRIKKKKFEKNLENKPD